LLEKQKAQDVRSALDQLTKGGDGDVDLKKSWVRLTISVPVDWKLMLAITAPITIAKNAAADL